MNKHTENAYRRQITVLSAVAGVALMALLPLTAFADTYTNPITPKYSLPDPTLIRADDGTFYLFATEDTHNVPVMKSTDLVKWRFAGTAFTDSTRPDFVEDGSIWAPDINYIDGQYVLYYAMSTWGGEWDCGIGVATASRPQGTYSDATELFISSDIGVQNSIDPFYIESDDGEKYLFWGSFRGIYYIQLSDDGLGLGADAEKVQIASTEIEATYIIKHDGYYYMFGSAGSCCEGASSTYHIVMARSRYLLGPYVNKDGYSILNHSFSLLLSGSDLVYGPGHNAELVEDDAGQYWIIYHGFDASDVDTGRKLYLDKIQWDTDGWPYIENSIPSESSDAPVFVTDGIDSPARYNDNSGVRVIQDGNTLVITSDATTPFEWQTTHANGTLAARGNGEGSASVDMDGMQPGIYVIRVKSATGVFCKKIVKH